MKPYSLYIMLGIAVVLDIISLILLVTGGALGFLVSIAGFFNTVVFVSAYVIALLVYLGTKENDFQKQEARERNPVVKREMQKIRGKVFAKIKDSIIVAKIEKMIAGAIAALVSAIPVIGSFVPAHTTAAIIAIRRANKIQKIIDGSGKDINKVKEKAQRSSRFRGGSMSPAPAQKIN